MRNLFTTVIIFALITACSTTSGKKISEDQLSFVKEGETTYDQVVKQLGPPNEESKGSDGTKHIVYRYDRASSDGKVFIPLVGPWLSSGVQTEGHYVSFVFDTKNVVKEYNIRKTSSENTTTY